MRLVLAGIRGAIAQRPRALSALVALAAAAALALAAPALAADPLAATTAAATQAASGTAQTLQNATQAPPAQVEQAAPAAREVQRDVHRVTDTTRTAASQAVREVTRSADAAPAAPQSVSAPAEPVTRTVAEVSGRTRSGPGATGPAASGAAKDVTDTLRGAGPVGSRGAGPLGDQLAGVVDGALRSLGDSLRGIVPLDALAAPVATLLADSGLAGLGSHTPLAFGNVFSESGSLEPRLDSGILGAGSLDSAAGLASPAQLASALTAPSLRGSQSASAQPPAAEAGGRSALPSPRKAQVPAAGGAAAATSAGLTFVPFLALLVLAALVAPKLMRRLDAAPALLRPSLFACALERPG